MKINFKKLLQRLYILFLITFSILALFNFATYPEMYISTWKYQLKCDIVAGDTEAIDYYQRTYLNKGIELFKLFEI